MDRSIINDWTLKRLDALADIALETQQKSGIKKEKLNIAEWCSKYLWIKPERGGIIRFEPNQFQMQFFDYCQKQFKKKLPIRLVLLKSRQLGLSTAVEAFFFYLLVHFPNTSALIVAHKREDARNIFRMMRRYYAHLSKDMRIPLVGGRPNKDNLEFSEPHSSTCSVFTAGGEEIGRSWSIQFAHLSEMAYYESQESVMTSINQAVAKSSSTWFSASIVESTANGLNLFHHYWQLAQDPDSIWHPMFFTWKDDLNCAIEIGQGEDFTLDKEEIDYQREHSLTLEQMKWAREMRRDQCHNSWAKFNQEYPVTPGLAFISTGYHVFNLTALSKMSEAAQDNPAVTIGDIGFMSTTQPIPKINEAEYGPLKIWEHPKKDREYVLGVDVAEGIGADYSEIVVIQKEPVIKVVAHYRDNTIKPQDFGVKCWLLGAYYYYGLLGIERNSVGMVVLGVVEHGHGDRIKFPQFQRYPHLYYDTRLDSKTVDESDKLGFRTSKQSKKTAISNLSELINDSDLVCYSVPILNQLQGFTWDPQSKGYSQSTKDDFSELYNDDSIIALAIANEMRLFSFGQRFVPRIARGDW